MNESKPLWKQILTIAWPLIIANSFWNLQLTIDRIFLGMYSTEALGAAMAVMGVFWVPMALLQGTASYITTFVAQYFGAKEQGKIGACVWQALYVSVFGGVTFLILNLLSPWFFSLLGHDPIVQRLEVEYFNSVAYSALPTALVATVSGFFTGLSRTRLVIGINFVGLILNAILDYLMIFGKWGVPAMGVAGAGYATALATMGAAIFGLFLLFKDRNSRQYNLIESWRPQLELIKQFMKYGFPSGLQWAFEGLAFTVFLIIMGQLSNGTVALSASSIAMTVMMLSVLPSMGVAQAVMPLVGQLLGDKKPDFAEKITWSGVRICCVYMLSVGISFYFIPELYINWFKNADNVDLWNQVSHVTAGILKIIAVFTVLDSIYLNVSFALKGAGDTRFVSLIALILPWPFMVLPAYLLRHSEFAVTRSWSMAAVYILILCVILILRFRGGKWKTMSVIHNSPQS